MKACRELGGGGLTGTRWEGRDSSKLCVVEMYRFSIH